MTLRRFSAKYKKTNKKACGKYRYMGVENLSRSDKKFLVENKAREPEFTPQELAILLKQEKGSPIKPETVKQFLQQGETQERIETRRSLDEKKSRVTKQDLINKLLTLEKKVEDQINEFDEQDRSRSVNNAVENMIDLVKLVGEVTDALQEKQDVQGNLIHIDKVEQNVHTVIQNLPKKEKKELVKDLSDELGLIVKKKRNDDKQ